MTAVLITGAAGFIGSHLSRGLLDRGYDVTGIDNLVTGDRRRVDHLQREDGFAFIEGDLTDRSCLERAMAGTEYVFHQAALASVARSFDRPVETARANCVGTANLLDAALDEGVSKVVVASSAAVYGSNAPLPVDEAQPVDPESPYALSKYWTERLALQFDRVQGLPAVALRYFNVFGPGQDPEGDYAAVIPAFVEAMTAGNHPVIYGDGEQSRDFVFVDDVVDANIRAAESDVSGDVFNVARGERTTVRELVASLNDVLESDLEPVHESARPGDVRHSLAAIDKARTELGFTADVGLREGLERMTAAGHAEQFVGTADGSAD